MQPYFFPYGGYYELMKSCDYFIIFDTAQFPRRGRVHRCQITSSNELISWLTLSIEKADFSSPISKINLSSNFDSILKNRIESLPQIKQKLIENLDLSNALFFKTNSLLDYLENQLKYVAKLKNWNCKFKRASEILDKNDQNYQDYICQIGNIIGGTKYVNLSGGYDLYNPEIFNSWGLEIEFLTLYQGSKTSILDSKEVI